MDQYRCQLWQLPCYLYRVQYPASRTIHDSSGLKAQDTTSVYKKWGSDDEFTQAIRNQFTWACKDSTPFISFFSDEEHAINWGCKLRKWDKCSRQDDWTLLTIDTQSLGSTYVYKLSTLIDYTGVQIPVEAEKSHKRGAYICLHGIPTFAIVYVRNGSDVRAARDCKLPIFFLSIDVD
ncbi:uncharacterized protein QC761_0000520 [Podospora bellae-mahoneyi]|uniref:DUF7587 domain-containing protein n=1 Tax=Podospora bellae-mahoneyi TaxID=2093777 RepID=A0ABR0FTV9_9PEZI|nr:hypothetical protein QC761_0000520 [Podospora bellae-mahoneyi]